MLITVTTPGEGREKLKEATAQHYSDGIGINLNPDNPAYDRIVDAAKIDFISGADWQRSQTIDEVVRVIFAATDWEDKIYLTSTELLTKIKNLK